MTGPEVDSPYGMDLTSAASFLRFVKHLGPKAVAAYREEIVSWVGAERAAFTARPQFCGHHHCFFGNDRRPVR